MLRRTLIAFLALAVLRRFRRAARGPHPEARRALPQLRHRPLGSERVPRDRGRRDASCATGADRVAVPDRDGDAVRDWAGSQVIAVDDQSNYPAYAPTTKLSGFQPNIEAIAGMCPTSLWCRSTREVT